MVARRKLCWITNVLDPTLWKAIEATAARERDRRALLKDRRLIEAALMTDGAVISLDEAVRGLFAAACVEVGAIRNIVWVNPTKVEEGAVPWLEDGARPERSRRLGAGES